MALILMASANPPMSSITSWEENIPHAWDMNMPHYGPNHVEKDIASSITGSSPVAHPWTWGWDLGCWQ